MNSVLIGILCLGAVVSVAAVDANFGHGPAWTLFGVMFYVGSCWYFYSIGSFDGQTKALREINAAWKRAHEAQRR